MTDPHDLDVLAERRTAVARSRPVQRPFDVEDDAFELGERGEAAPD